MNLWSKYGLFIMMVMIYNPYIMLSQTNIKVGYIGGFTSAPDLNGIISNFNEDFVSKHGGKIYDELDRVKSLHGLEIGIRHRINNVGFELSWHNMSDKSDMYGELPTNPTFQTKWFTSLTEYALGVENYFGKLGYGAAIGYRTLRIKTDIKGAQRKKRAISTQSGLVSRFYLLFQYPGEKVGIAFKPYVQVPLKSLSLTDFDRELNLLADDAYQVSNPIEEKFTLFGISIVLYNGRQ
ncbi:MAG: hypothetical protein J5I52_09265 [Saprospiraceae bacterium]|nr:MAG: hypothetical protein UZ09_BCD002001259 [Bacteroidetes bacterium OLB9]MCO6464325.1 hypothetical protein [Saprospiraceae bacterium]MCZ2338304.1 hypothetical protein [Chitinophagales bacterium]